MEMCWLSSFGIGFGRRRFRNPVIILIVTLMGAFLSRSVVAQPREPVCLFAKLPRCGLSQKPFLPTPNTRLFTKNYEGYVAQTRTNSQYGLPGWTRGQGRRFHKGVDILPVHFEKTKGIVRIEYYDPKKNREFSVNEPILIPKDEIFAILDGAVVVANHEENRSGYGRYIIIEHQFADGTPFLSMYAHLNELEVKQGQAVRGGERIGWMGQTSSNPGGREYLKAIPHCHFEIGRVINKNFSTSLIARHLFPPILGGKFDPRNIQPYNPIDFLTTYHAQPYSESGPQQLN